MQEDSRFPFRTSIIIKPPEISVNELINYPKTSSIIELRSENDKEVAELVITDDWPLKLAVSLLIKG